MWVERSRALGPTRKRTQGVLDIDTASPLPGKQMASCNVHVHAHVSTAPPAGQPSRIDRTHGGGQKSEPPRGPVGPAVLSGEAASGQLALWARNSFNAISPASCSLLSPGLHFHAGSVLPGAPSPACHGGQMHAQLKHAMVGRCVPGSCFDLTRLHFQRYKLIKAA